MGIDIQNMPLGQPFYNTRAEEWCVLHLANDSESNYEELLISLFNNPEGEFYGSDGNFTHLRSTGQAVRIYSMACY